MKQLLSLAILFSFSFSIRAQDKLGQYKKLIIGKWVSTEDKNSRSTYTSDGKVIDDYTGTESTTSTYSITYDSKGKQYILTTKAPGDEDPFIYTIDDISKTTLSLVYQARGNTLTFKRAVVQSKKKKS